jgi:uncharacterized cupredoxin-like copper-binding protein
VVLAGLSTGHELGLGLSGAAFILFALASAMLIPRFRPDFPGRSLGVFVLVSLLFFGGMLTAVVVFGAANTPARHRAGSAAATTQAPISKTVQVSEREFKIFLSSTRLSAGTVTFHVKNVGHIPHNLVIAGTNHRTRLIAPGQTATLVAQLKTGTYELYCAVPGHKQLGMDAKVQVQ